LTSGVFNMSAAPAATLPAPIATPTQRYLFDAPTMPALAAPSLAGSLFASTQNGDGSGDVLIGGAGDDILVGGDGRDFLISGFGQSSEQRDRATDRAAPAAVPEDSAAASDVGAAYYAVFEEAGAADAWIAGELNLAQLWVLGEE